MFRNTGEHIPSRLCRWHSYDVVYEQKELNQNMLKNGMWLMDRGLSLATGNTKC